MAVLLENITNSVWQAFSYLQIDKSGFVLKSKLKVLTANIGTILDLYGVEKGLEHFRSTTSLNFDQFKYYLQREVFSSLPDEIHLSELREYESRIAEVCWLVCRKKYLERDNKVFTDAAVFKLYRIFSVLAELIPDNYNVNTYEVLLHSTESYSLAQTLCNSLGGTFDEEDFTTLSLTANNFRLSSFLAILETKCLVDIKDQVAISEAVTDIYQTIVEDVIKKGIMSKKGYIFPTMREYWFVLRPSELTYFKSRSEKERCGTISIQPGSRIEPKTGYKIALHTPERTYDFGTSDHMTRLQWISSLELAIDHCSGSQSYQRLQCARRRLLRQGRIQEMLKAKMQLQQERSARQIAEGQAKELEAVVKEESKKLNDLEKLRIKLEKLLEEETQAKRDEEIVRSLQARVLAEEWEKREELERLQEEQRGLLEEERGKRIEFEEHQRENEQQLKEAQERLKQLEKERRTLDEQLKQAHDKIKRSGSKKELIETRLIQVAPNLGAANSHVRRAHSFMASSKERPVVLAFRPPK